MHCKMYREGETLEGEKIDVDLLPNVFFNFQDAMCQNLCTGSNIRHIGNPRWRPLGNSSKGPCTKIFLHF